MPSTLDFSAAWATWITEAGDDCAFAMTVPNGYETGTWTAKVYSDERAPIAMQSATVAVVGQVVTFTVSHTQTAALMSTKASRFDGFFRIKHTDGSNNVRTMVKGPFQLPAGRQ